MMLDGAEEFQLSSPIGELVPYSCTADDLTCGEGDGLAATSQEPRRIGERHAE
jgi:hypothetical protein